MIRNISRTGVFLKLCALVLGCFLIAVTSSHGQDGPIDPSGHWEGQYGPLALMLAGNNLYFSYAAVFGEAAHICDGVGVATLADDNLYYHVHEMGTVAFIITREGVQMNTIDGVAPFCGAHWPGDKFPQQSFKPVHPCTVVVPKTFFHAVMLEEPAPLAAYVLDNDPIEVVFERNNLGNDWVLARFQGPRMATVGLLKKDDLACPVLGDN